MEAPEKIYVDKGTDFSEAVFYVKNFKSKESDVEYSRTDVIVERAIGWIDYNNRNGGCFFDGWENDFKKYIKGE